MYKIVVLLFVVGLIEVYSTAEHNHKDEPSRRSNILSNLNQKLKSMRRTIENFEGCCDGLDPMMLQEVQPLSQNFGEAWESIMQKYNMNQVHEFVQTLDVISEAVLNLKTLNVNPEPPADLMARMNNLLLRRTRGKRSLRRNSASGGLDPQMIADVDEIVSNFSKAWEEIMVKYKVKPIAQFTTTLDTITQAFVNVKELISGFKKDALDGDDFTIQVELEQPEPEDQYIFAETDEPAI